MSTTNHSDRQQGLRLFVAADIAGSTLFKAKRPVRAFTKSVLRQLSADNPDAQQLIDWASIFQTFFSDFIEELRRTEENSWAAEERKYASQQYSSALFGNRAPPQARLRPWKILGDEVVLVCELRDPLQLYLQVRTFWQTVRKFDEQLRSIYGLGLKGRVWTAGFPIRNRAVKISTTASPAIISTDDGRPSLEEINPVRNALYQFEDYIGLDMDIGFRLGSHSSSGRVLSSIEPLFFLAKADPTLDLRIFHIGWRSLPGVYEDRPYPIVWIDFNGGTDGPSPLFPYEAEMNGLARDHLSMTSPTDPTDVIQLVEGYLNSLGGAMIRPYIHSYEMDVSHRPIDQRRTKKKEG